MRCGYMNLCIFRFYILFYFKQILLMQMFLLLFLITCSSNNRLGNNLISNPKFLEPNIISKGFLSQMIPKNIPGWSCKNTCQINNCQQLSELFIQFGMVFGNCKGQVLDVSSSQIQIITQMIQTTQGNHNLSIQYFIPTFSANKKTLLIYFNKEMIYSYRPLIAYDSNPYKITLNIKAKRGGNNLTFTQRGQNDSYGFKLASVQLRRQINPQIQSFTRNISNNQLTLGVVSIPGSRILFGGLVSSLVSFDRMQLYYYHQRNYSYYTDMLLNNITTLMNSKGQFSLNTQAKILGNAAAKYQSFLSQCDYKYNYIYMEGKGKLKNGYGFVTKNANLFVYSIPFYVVSIGVFYLVFWLTFKHKISLFVRKYSFFGVIFLLMLCEGNIQQYSFYAFGEFKTFFSANYKHKIVNLVITGFFYAFLLSSLTLMFMVLENYKKKCKYFIDNVEICFGGITAYTISNGFIFFLLGALHQLLLKTPNIQLLALGITELLCISVHLVFLSLNFYKIKWMVWRNIISGLVRIAFQLTLYLYQISESQGLFINQEIHLKQILIFITVWILQLLGSILMTILYCVKMIRKTEEQSLPTNKIIKKEKQQRQLKKVTFA